MVGRQVLALEILVRAQVSQHFDSLRSFMAIANESQGAKLELSHWSIIMS